MNKSKKLRNSLSLWVMFYHSSSSSSSLSSLSSSQSSSSNKHFHLHNSRNLLLTLREHTREADKHYVENRKTFTINEVYCLRHQESSVSDSSAHLANIFDHNPCTSRNHHNKMPLLRVSYLK